MSGITSCTDLPLRFKTIEENKDCTQKVLEKVTSTLSFALFIIGCVAAAGHMTGVVAGGCII